jgi:15-cis-phytoene synthase
VSELDDSLVNRAAPPGSMRYFSLLYAPDDRREVLLAMHVIDAEIRESAQSPNHDVAHTRLQWWRAEVDRLVNAAPQHPATKLLSERTRQPRSAFAKLHELLVAADMDLARMTYATAQELRAYSSRSGGALQELIAAELVAPDSLSEDLRQHANRLGTSLRQVEMIRDLRQDAYEGRIYLPLDLLDRHGLRVEQLRERDYTPEVKAALKTFGDSVRGELVRTPRTHEPRLRAVFVLSALHRRLLDRIAARDFDVARERIDLGPIEKPWVAWRAARASG